MTIASLTAFVEPYAPALSVLFGLVVALSLVTWVTESLIRAAAMRDWYGD